MFNSKSNNKFQQELKKISEDAFSMLSKKTSLSVVDKIVDDLWWKIWHGTNVRMISRVTFDKIEKEEKKWTS